MKLSDSKKRRILITGGTSGLGKALALHFLNDGYEVVITGRNKPESLEWKDNLTFLETDFSNLAQTSCLIYRECRIRTFDIVVNNAGILGPPDFRSTVDGFEYTFQVNFLAHLMINEIILGNTNSIQPLKIVAVVSPVYRIGDRDLNFRFSDSSYKAFKAYSNSKLYLTLMCSFLPKRHPMANLLCFSFDPGVFRSGIYRSQKEWFRFLYGIAGPFMRNPERIARSLFEIIESERILNGALYRSFGKTVNPKPVDSNENDSSFWRECYSLIEPYLK